MIRIWRDRKLAEELRDGAVSERDTLHYLLINTLLFSAMTMRWMTPEALPVTTIEYVSNVAELLLVTGGLIYAFRCNLDGRDFLRRVICLTIPLSVRFLVWAVLAIMAIALVMLGATYAGWLTRFNEMSYEEAMNRMIEVSLLIVLPVLYVGLYRRLGSHLRLIATDALARNS